MMTSPEGSPFRLASGPPTLNPTLVICTKFLMQVTLPYLQRYKWFEIESWLRSWGWLFLKIRRKAKNLKTLLERFSIFYQDKHIWSKSLVTVRLYTIFEKTTSREQLHLTAILKCLFEVYWSVILSILENFPHQSKWPVLGVCDR